MKQKLTIYFLAATLVAIGLITIVILLPGHTAQAQSGGGYVISGFGVAEGGGASSGSGYTTSGTLNQPENQPRNPPRHQKSSMKFSFRLMRTCFGRSRVERKRGSKSGV